MDPLQSDWTRRRFLRTSAAALAAGPLAGTIQAQDQSRAAESRTPAPAHQPKLTLPLVVASGNGLRAVEKAMSLLRAGADPVDAVIAGVNIIEDDPNDHSVGLGGLPNEDGVVELDSCCMHGPTHKAGAVAALRNIRNASSVARLVMQRTDHVLLVGEGALRFAKIHGFKEEELLTDEARQMWLEWKETHSDIDDWLAPTSRPASTTSPAPTTRSASMTQRAMRRLVASHTWGTINCCAVDAAANVGGVTTTSGLAYKIPGRVGDSPIIGAGLYVDNAVGAAGSTGRGEANLVNCSSFQVVELMRTGLHPRQACLEVLKRVADHTEPRLRDKQGRPAFGLTFYAVAKDGRYGAAGMYAGEHFTVHDGTQARHEDCAYLYENPEFQIAPSTKGGQKT